jgi:RNA polymerase sigma factor (sigma-70 family)
MYNILLQDCSDNHVHHRGFVAGEEKSLAYIYKHAWQPLQHIGLRIVNNEFVISCILQEAMLHGWEHRSVMKNTRHIYFFIRQNLIWKCFTWLRSKQHTFYNYRCTSFDSVFMDDEYKLALMDERTTEVIQAEDEKRKLIYNAIPYLPPTNQNIVTLSLKYGFSYKQIAARVGASATAVSIQLQETARHLKQIIQGSHSFKIKERSGDRLPNLNRLDTIKEKIVSMRRKENKSFEYIAANIGLDATEVKSQYIDALRIMRKN